jgi:hypothetical protein
MNDNKKCDHNGLKLMTIREGSRMQISELALVLCHANFPLLFSHCVRNQYKIFSDCFKTRGRKDILIKGPIV